MSQATATPSINSAKTVDIYVNGGFRQSAATETVPVTNPANQAVIAYAPLTTMAEVDEAVAAAQAAFLLWRRVPAPERARIMMKYQMLLKDNHDQIAAILALETGKTFADAQGDVWRGIEVVEQGPVMSPP